MAFKFENLRVWQKSLDFTVCIYDLSKTLPHDERFNLISQINRAADSIALNIAEGSTGQTNPEFKKFMGYAIRSLAEVITCLHKAKRRNYISQEEFLQLYEFAFNLMNMMIAFTRNIK